jgi:hypothetical protein
MDENTQTANNVLSRLSSLQQRSKNKINRTMETRMIPSSTEKKVELEEEVYQDAEVATEVVAQRVKDDEQFKKAQTMAEQVIPSNPIQLKGKTDFVPDQMYEQVKNDYIGIIRQSINSALDKLTVFYMRGNRFKEQKDMRIFLMQSLQGDIHELKKQYIAKYPLISGLDNMLSLVERQESLVFKSMVDDFLNRMIGNTFTS